MRTLIVAPNWIGDAVMAQPLLALLRRGDPHGTIDVLAPAHVGAVFAAMAEVGEVMVAPQAHGRLQLAARWRLARALRARRYDRAYVLPNSLKSAIVPWLAGIRVRVGYRGEARRGLVNRMHAPAPSRRPMVEFYAQLAAEPGAPVPAGVPEPRLACDEDRIARTLRKFGVHGAEPLFVLAPGAEYGPAKRWPARHYAALAVMVAAEWPEANIVLLGGPKDRALATEITALSGQALKNLCGDTSLEEAIALIAGASGVVSNDSGLMHVAAAFARPQVAVFGSSDPRHTPPRSERARVEWLHLDCSPCFQRECPLGHLNCLNGLPPQQVFESLRAAMHLEPAHRPPR